MTNLPLLVDAALARDADRPAVEFQGRWYKWGELRTVAQAVIQGLAQQGVDPQAVVAFVPRNHPASLAVLLALLSQGRTIKMVYAFQSAEGVARDIARLAPAAVILHQQDMADALDDLLNGQGPRDQGLPYIVLDQMDVRVRPMGQASAEDPAATPMAGLPCGRTGQPRDRLESDPSPNPYIGILTSGTTGPPKQFSLYYSTIEQYFLASPLTNSQASDSETAPPFLLYFPLGNITGIYSTLPMLLRGQPLVLLERFQLDAWHDYVVRYRPSHAGLPPTAFQHVLEADIPTADLSSLLTLGTGAAPLDPQVQAAFEDRYGIAILLSYGATEFAGPVAMMTADLHRKWGQEKRGSVGMALPGAELRIMDPNQQQSLGPNQEGLVQVRVKRMGDAWIATSDMGLIDTDGFLFLKGRADGAIMRGGFKILPETVERAILQHPAIAEVAVVGIADQRLGQVPAALVRTHKNHPQPSVTSLQNDLRRHVLATHIPVKWRFCDALPMNPSQKIDRQFIKQMFENE